MVIVQKPGKPTCSVASFKIQAVLMLHNCLEKENISQSM